MSDWGKVVFVKARGSWAVKGKWQGRRVQISQLLTMNGPVTCTTHRMAEMLKGQINNDIQKGCFNPERYKRKPPLQLREYSRKWLQEIKVEIADSTHSDYTNSINNHILPVLGDMFLPDIGHEDLKRLLNTIKREPKGKKNVMGCLHRLMVDSRKAGHISQLPEWVEFKGQNEVVQKDIEWIDLETQQKILAKIPSIDRWIFTFIMATGCRPSEARAFRKQDIKSSHGYIVFKKTFGKGEKLKEVKSKRERRFPITEGVQWILENCPRYVSEFVFVNSRTGRTYTKNINRDFWNPASIAVLGYVFPLNNAGRHSLGSQMAEAGYDMDTIAALLGHSNTAITKKHYANPSMRVLRSVVDNVRRFGDLKAVKGNGFDS